MKARGEERCGCDMVLGLDLMLVRVGELASQGAEVAKLVRDFACDEFHKWCAVGVSISTDPIGVAELGLGRQVCKIDRREAWAE